MVHGVPSSPYGVLFPLPICSYRKVDILHPANHLPKLYSEKMKCPLPTCHSVSLTLLCSARPASRPRLDLDLI